MPDLRVIAPPSIRRLLYLIGAVSEPRASATRAAVVACVLLTLSIGRGTYVLLVERPERALTGTTSTI